MLSSFLSASRLLRRLEHLVWGSWRISILVAGFYFGFIKGLHCSERTNIVELLSRRFLPREPAGFEFGELAKP